MYFNSPTLNQIYKHEKTYKITIAKYVHSMSTLGGFRVFGRVRFWVEQQKIIISNPKSPKIFLDNFGFGMSILAVYQKYLLLFSYITLIIKYNF